MNRSFTTATDDKLIELIQSAAHRLIIVTPGLTTPVAQAIEERIGYLSAQSLTVVLDADPEVYRIGYGDVEALEIIRKASSQQHFELREQPGVRIGVVVSDRRTMVYSPVPRNVEAAPSSAENPNALVIEGEVAETLAHATALAGPRTEVGQAALKPERVNETVTNLSLDPPQPFDLSRKLKVFRSEVQFVELKITNATFRSRRISLPARFQKLNDQDLRTRISSTLKVPIDLETEMEILIGSGSSQEKMKVNDKCIVRLRQELERVFFHDWKARGKVILRRDKERAGEQLNRLVEIIKAYHLELKGQLDENRKAFRKQLVVEFLDLWKQQPPVRLEMRGLVDEESCRADLELEADLLFDKAVEFDDPHHTIVYKDVAIEDLSDPVLMKELEQLMRNARVSEETLTKLFEVVDAAPATESMRHT